MAIGRLCYSIGRLKKRPKQRNAGTDHLTKLRRSSLSFHQKLLGVPTCLTKNCSTDHPASKRVSFSQGCFPYKFKTSIMTPLLKKPTLDSSQPCNNRPTAVLNNISKITERLFLHRIRPRVVQSSNFNSPHSLRTDHFIPHRLICWQP